MHEGSSGRVFCISATTGHPLGSSMGIGVTVIAISLFYDDLRKLCQKQSRLYHSARFKSRL